MPQLVRLGLMPLPYRSSGVKCQRSFHGDRREDHGGREDENFPEGGRGVGVDSGQMK